MACKWRWRRRSYGAASWRRGAGPERGHGNPSQEGQMGERLESVGPQDVWPGRFWNSFDSQRADNTVVVAFVAQLIIPFFFGSCTTLNKCLDVAHVLSCSSDFFIPTECTWLYSVKFRSELFCGHFFQLAGFCLCKFFGRKKIFGRKLGAGASSSPVGTFWSRQLCNWWFCHPSPLINSPKFASKTENPCPPIGWIATMTNSMRLW